MHSSFASYCLCVDALHPGSLYIASVLPTLHRNPRREYFAVTPEGFYFRRKARFECATVFGLQIMEADALLIDTIGPCSMGPIRVRLLSEKKNIHQNLIKLSTMQCHIQGQAETGKILV